jgi:hypothetical protein
MQVSGVTVPSLLVQVFDGYSSMVDGRLLSVHDASMYNAAGTVTHGAMNTHASIHAVIHALIHVVIQASIDRSILLVLEVSSTADQSTAVLPSEILNGYVRSVVQQD